MDRENVVRVFVIGPLGSDRVGVARSLAAELGYRFVDLDREIEAFDGRSVQRICMMMGEHEYRNQEFEALKRLGREKNIVVACGVGVVLDEMNVALLQENAVVVADSDKGPEELWEAFQVQDHSLYAFMLQSDESEKKESFLSLYESRKPLYNQFI